MTAPDPALTGLDEEAHVLGGLTREEALLVYDVGQYGAATDGRQEQILEIGRRVSAELRLLERASDIPGLEKYVRHLMAEEHPDDFETLLEQTVDDLERGYSDTMDSFAEWRRDRKRARKQRRRDLVLLAEAGDARCNELQDEIDNGNLPRGDVSRMKRELRALHGAVYRLWERIQK